MLSSRFAHQTEVLMDRFIILAVGQSVMMKVNPVNFQLQYQDQVSRCECYDT